MTVIPRAPQGDLGGLIPLEVHRLRESQGRLEVHLLVGIPGLTLLEVLRLRGSQGYPLEVLLHHLGSCIQGLIQLREVHRLGVGELPLLEFLYWPRQMVLLDCTVAHLRRPDSNPAKLVSVSVVSVCYWFIV